MKEHPILFSGEMVRAILDGRKTQTRRVIKPQPDENLNWIANERGVMAHTESGFKELMTRHCPYGVPGDMLWVRETWQYCPFCGGTNYKAGANDSGRSCQHCDNELGVIWKPSIHMRYEDGRITLRVTNVRVEQVQEIGHDDAMAEGISDVDMRPYGYPTTSYAVANFRTLWDSINAARGFGWDTNPWVWVVEFERVTEVTK